MSYERERKVTHVVKDTLVWLPGDQHVLLDNHQPLEIADSASLAEVGLCSLEELMQLRTERDEARAKLRARDADILVLNDALKTAQDTREGAVLRADKAEAERDEARAKLAVQKDALDADVEALKAELAKMRSNYGKTVMAPHPAAQMALDAEQRAKRCCDAMGIATDQVPERLWVNGYPEGSFFGHCSEESAHHDAAVEALFIAEAYVHTRVALRTRQDAVKAETERCVDVIRECWRVDVHAEQIVNAIRKGAAP